MVFFRSFIALGMVAILGICTLVPSTAHAKPKSTISKSNSDARLNAVRNFRS